MRNLVDCTRARMEIDAFMMQGDFPPYFLVRRVRGQERALVTPLREWQRPRILKHRTGVTVIDHSLSDALELADRLINRPREVA